MISPWHSRRHWRHPALGSCLKLERYRIECDREPQPAPASFAPPPLRCGGRNLQIPPPPQRAGRRTMVTMVEGTLPRAVRRPKKSAGSGRTVR